MAVPVGVRIANKYPGECRTCLHLVEVGKGWAVRGRSGWTIYCTAHVPPPGQPPKPPLPPRGRTPLPVRQYRAQVRKQRRR